MDELILSDLFNIELVIGLVVAFFNGLIHGYTGFGGALLIVPVLTFLYGPVEAIGISCIIAIVGGVRLVFETSRQANWRELIPIFMGIIVLTPVGAWFLFNIDPDLVRRSMGGFILIFALTLLSGWSYRGSRGTMLSALVGSVTGIINGLTGVGGPTLALYYLSSDQSADVQRANIVMCIMVLTIAMFCAVIIGDGYSYLVIIRAVIVAPAYLFGVVSGAWLFKLAPKSYFKNIALLILVITGLSALAV